MQNITDRRKTLLCSFGKKIEKSSRFKSWLSKYLNTCTRVLRNPRKYNEINCNRNRYKNSGIPSILKILNVN